MRRPLLILVTTIGLLFGLALPALAFEPVNVVHTERVQAGPYGITVGFSTWPIRAMQSLDFTFAPDDGIADRSGTVTATGPEGEQVTQPLARHPRQREVWGLDVQSLPSAGNWTFQFTVDGPAGTGVGELRDLNVLEQPGPPLGLSWGISTLPLLGLVVLLVLAWRNTPRPATAGSSATLAKRRTDPKRTIS